MKILIVPSWYPSEDQPINGVFFKEQVKALKKSGIEPIVAYVDIRSFTNFSTDWKMGYHFSIEDGIPTYRYNMYHFLPKVPGGEGKLTLFFLRQLYKKIIRQEGPVALIHAHSVIWGGYAASMLAKKYQIPFIVTEHYSIYLKKLLNKAQREATVYTFQQANQIVAVSEALKNKLQSYTDKQIEVVPNIVDVSHFQYESISKKDKPFIFFSAAFLHKAKGMEDVILAFKQSFHRENNTMLYLAGDGEEREHLQQMVEEAGLTKQVVFLGALSREEIASWMKKSHVFVLASHFETFGVVFIEATASGRPVIGTYCGGPEDIIHKKNGLLVPVEDVESLANAMKELKQKYDTYSGEAIRKDCMERFSEEVVVHKIYNIYSQVML